MAAAAAVLSCNHCHAQPALHYNTVGAFEVCWRWISIPVLLSCTPLTTIHEYLILSVTFAHCVS